MAGRGGYQKPKPRQGVSGPGKFSKRTDGDQPIREPDIDSPGMQYGDRTMAREAQRSAPLRQGGGMSKPGANSPPPQRQPSGGAVSQGGLPSWLLDAPSTRPQEAVTAGMDVGPGAGSEVLASRRMAPDIREQVLEYLVMNFRTESATDMLEKLRARRVKPPMPTGQPASGGLLQPELGPAPEAPAPELAPEEMP